MQQQLKQNPRHSSIPLLNKQTAVGTAKIQNFLAQKFTSPSNPQLINLIQMWEPNGGTTLYDTIVENCETLSTILKIGVQNGVPPTQFRIHYIVFCAGVDNLSISTLENAQNSLRNLVKKFENVQFNIHLYGLKLSNEAEALFSKISESCSQIKYKNLKALSSIQVQIDDLCVKIKSNCKNLQKNTIKFQSEQVVNPQSPKLRSQSQKTCRFRVINERQQVKKVGQELSKLLKSLPRQNTYVQINRFNDNIINNLQKIKNQPIPHPDLVPNAPIKQPTYTPRNNVTQIQYIANPQLVIYNQELRQRRCQRICICVWTSIVLSVGLTLIVNYS